MDRPDRINHEQTLRHLTKDVFVFTEIRFAFVQPCAVTTALCLVGNKINIDAVALPNLQTASLLPRVGECRLQKHSAG